MYQWAQYESLISLSCVWLFVTPWTVAHQAPPFMGFSRQEYWSGLPFPSPGELPYPGIKPGSPTLQADALLSEPKIMASGPITSWQIDGETVETVSDFIVGGSKITADVDCSHEIKRCLLLGRKVMTNLDGILKSRDITLPTKVRLVKTMVFPVVMWMWGLDCEESWAPKNWGLWTVVLEKTLERPLDCKEIQPVHSKGDQSWVFIGRTDAKAETPILWPPHAKSWLIGKDSDAGRAWGQEEKGMTEDEMAGWHHWLDAHEFE